MFYNYSVHISASSPQKLQDVIKHPSFSAEALRKYYSISQEDNVELHNKEGINETSNSIVVELDYFFAPPILFLKQFIDIEPSLTIEIRGWYCDIWDSDTVLVHYLLSNESTYLLFDEQDLRNEINESISEDYYYEWFKSPLYDYWLIDTCFTVMERNGGRSWRKLAESGTYNNHPREYGDVLSFPLDLIPEKYHQEFMRDPLSLWDKARNIVRSEEERIRKEHEELSRRCMAEFKQTQLDKAEAKNDEELIVTDCDDDEDDDVLPF